MTKESFSHLKHSSFVEKLRTLSVTLTLTLTLTLNLNLTLNLTLTSTLTSTLNLQAAAGPRR